MSEQRSSVSTPMPEDIKTRKVELVLQQLDALPTLPAIVVRLLSLTNSADSPIEEVVQLLSADQSLTTKLLSLAGSAAAGIRAPVTSVRQAVVMLGFETVRNLALSVKVFETYQQEHESQPDAPPAFKREEFWKHSLAVATAAEMLAGRSQPRLCAADAFVCGLLHDIGKVAFDTAMPKSFARVVEMATLTRGDIADVERRVIGLDHALAGKRLAESWNLPQVITQVIWFHGSPPPSGAAPTANTGGLVNPGMVLVVGLADLLVRRQHIGYSGNYLFPYDVEEYTRPLGLSDADVQEVTGQLADALEARARAIGLYDVESRQVYLESIANANAELGRANHQLQLQNRKLILRSKCFELLTRFYQRIVPAASPAQLLTEIGQVAHSFLESSRLVLFSQDPDQSGSAQAGVANETPAGAGSGIGEVLLFDPTRAAHDSFLMRMPQYGGDQRVGRATQSFLRPASPQLDWLLERVGGFLGASQCSFMPLLCGHEPVGGLLWVAKDGASMAALAGLTDLPLVAQSWGMTLRTAQIREQQTILTESLAATNRQLGTLQQQQVRLKSLASLGEMAAGAGHEMNNPLQVMCGRAQLLAAKLSDAAMKQEASLIFQQGQRLSQIITDMMEFAKPVAPKFGPVGMKAVVEEAVKLAQQRATGPGGGTGGGTGGGAGDVPVRVEVAPGIPEVRADERQIRIALAEVILNALQATVAKEADPPTGHTAGEVTAHVRFDPLDQQIIVQVHDHGVGMSQEVMKNAFAPFFSAKTAGRNRGMGLAKALRYVENHRGTIRLDSVHGQGTTAVVILPLNAGEAAGNEGRSAPEAAAGARGAAVKR